MPYATIMVYVDADQDAGGRVRLAAELAVRFNATLMGLSAQAPRPPFVAEGVVVDALSEADIEGLRAKLARKGEWFSGIAHIDQRMLEWRAVLEIPNDALAREARGAQLVVIGQARGPSDIYGTLDPGGAILQLGRPALVVPDGVNALRAERVLIGWKDTRESRRAVQDALPFLQRAARVSIAEICEPGGEDAARTNIDDVSRYLTRSRVNGGPKIIVHQEGSDASQMIRIAQEEDADLMVTGAYGRSRLGEWIFGGMTHELLAHCPICCLMSH